MDKPKVVIAMSGGVDSSVTAALLQKQGYDCIGMHLNFWVDPEQSYETAHVAQNKCCTLEGLTDARRVCAQLGIPFYVMNAVDSFKEKVVDHFLDTYTKGETPNPCIECNRNIKFGQLLTRAKELGADFLASGHYAKVEKHEHEGREPTYELKMAKDKAKDQSYFIYHLGQEKLKHVLFPLGDMLKSEVYELAKEFKLTAVEEKAESQGLCFFPESKPIYFLKRYLPKEMFAAGDIVTTDGRVVGKHKGLPLYTIGQRQGLGIGGIKGEPDAVPWYVVKLDRERNLLVVGREEDIYRHNLIVDNVEWVSGVAPTEAIDIEIRIRHRSAPVPATVRMEKSAQGKSQAIVESKNRLKGVAPGQAAVFYHGETVLGGGIISSLSISYSYGGPEKEKVLTKK